MVTKAKEKPRHVVVLPDRKQEFCSWLGMERRFGLKNLTFAEHGIYFDKT